jgi:hypothetical protein
VPRTAPQPDAPPLTIESAGDPAALCQLLPPDSVRRQQSDEQRRNVDREYSEAGMGHRVLGHVLNTVGPSWNSERSPKAKRQVYTLATLV